MYVNFLRGGVFLHISARRAVSQTAGGQAVWGGSEQLATIPTSIKGKNMYI